MGNELATQKETRLAKPQPEFSNEQIKLLAETVAKGCDQNELAFFLQVAKLKRLDPFTGQIHCVKRWDSSLGKEKITVQTGVDGYRVIAARTNDLAGIDDPEYDTDTESHPNWAKVTVYRYGRGDEKVPYKATARWGEYVQVYKDKQTGELKPNPMWQRMPYLMLGKVAEALALRKAFPDELSGMYTNEEMDQADNETPGVTPASVMKPQVSMPKSTDEKKPPVQTAKAETVQQGQQTQQGSAQGQQSVSKGPEQISGEIEKVSPGKGAQEGTLWLVVNKKLICIPENLIDAEMCVGAKVLITAVEAKGGSVQKYIAIAVEMVVPPVQEGEIVDAEYVEDKPAEEAKGPDPVLEEARAAGLSGIFDETPPKKTAPSSTTTPDENPGTPDPPATEATKPGTIGLKRAKRLYALISQGHKNTGFTEEECKKIMASLPHPIEHVRDIELGMYGEFEAWATGEKDFQDFWKD